jgi:Domain of unknown function (DUF1835)
VGVRLHVTNGESAASTLQRMALGGAVLCWQDALHEGPVRAQPRPALLRTRAGFLSECGWGTRSAILSSLELRDRQLREAFDGGVPVVLWFEHDLHDQLQLLDVLALAHEAGTAPDAIVVDSFPGRSGFRGLGELSPDELETLWPTRREATVAALDVAVGAWSAVCANEPTALAAWAASGSRELPLAAPALRRLLAELPGAADGLSGTERRAMQAIAAGATSPSAAFIESQRLEDAPFLGDSWFYRALARLGGGPVRLVETEEGDPLPAPPPLGDGEVFSRLRLRLTDEGRWVLHGEADRVELLGVDRWIGGTHITSDSAWRWDETAQALAPPPTRGETGRA